jgi:membrane protease YdiL (CAAX protease family)
MAALELVVLRLARGRLAELWVTRRRLLPALLAGLLTWPLSLAFALAYALHRLGHFAWMPLSEYPSTIGNALFFPLTEELLFRGLLLSLLVAWGVRPWAANLLAATLFVLAHPRYLLVIPGYSGPTRPDVWLAAMVLAVGLLAGAVALRYRNVWGAVVVHAGANFLIFVPIGAVIKSL